MRHRSRRVDPRLPLLAALALVVGLRAGAALPVAMPLPDAYGHPPATAATAPTGLSHAAFAVG